jgi:hypothetical protein
MDRTDGVRPPCKRKVGVDVSGKTRIGSVQQPPRSSRPRVTRNEACTYWSATLPTSLPVDGKEKVTDRFRKEAPYARNCNAELTGLT